MDEEGKEALRKSVWLSWWFGRQEGRMRRKGKVLRCGRMEMEGWGGELLNVGEEICKCFDWRKKEKREWHVHVWEYFGLYALELMGLLRMFQVCMYVCFQPFFFGAYCNYHHHDNGFSSLPSTSSSSQPPLHTYTRARIVRQTLIFSFIIPVIAISPLILLLLLFSLSAWHHALSNISLNPRFTCPLPPGTHTSCLDIIP